MLSGINMFVDGKLAWQDRKFVSYTFTITYLLLNTDLYLGQIIAWSY